MAAAAAGATAAPTVPVYVSAAVADTSRPADDSQARRRPQAGRGDRLLRHEAGWTIADYIPGGGYYDRIFAGVVGPKGHVYAFYPSRDRRTSVKDVTLPPSGTTPWLGAANVTAIIAPANEFAAPSPLDLVWISDNYHDLHDPFFAPADLAKVNAAVFKALKPGGIYLIARPRAPRPAPV